MIRALRDLRHVQPDGATGHGDEYDVFGDGSVVIFQTPATRLPFLTSADDGRKAAVLLTGDSSPTESREP